MRTKDKPKNQKQNIIPLEKETWWSRSNSSMYFILTYSQSHIATNLFTAISRICLDEGLVLLKEHLTLQIY